MGHNTLSIAAHLTTKIVTPEIEAKVEHKITKMIESHRAALEYLLTLDDLNGNHHYYNSILSKINEILRKCFGSYRSNTSAEICKAVLLNQGGMLADVAKVANADAAIKQISNVTDTLSSQAGNYIDDLKLAAPSHEIAISMNLNLSNSGFVNSVISDLHTAGVLDASGNVTAVNLPVQSAFTATITSVDYQRIANIINIVN